MSASIDMGLQKTAFDILFLKKIEISLLDKDSGTKAFWHLAFWTRHERDNQ